MKAPRRGQQGFTLVIALTLLVLMTTIVLTTFLLGRSSLQVVDNLQQRNQAQAASQEALDKVISGTLFTTTPNAVFPGTTCSGDSIANGICVDINGDNRTLVAVTVSPVLNGSATPPFCVQSKTLKNINLDPINPYDSGCIAGQVQNFGIAGASSTGDSLCADTVWEVNAAASEKVSSASVLVTEGVAIRTSVDVVDSFCP